MPQKCFYKPNRSHPREFTTTDAARVLCYAYKAQQGVSSTPGPFRAYVMEVGQLAAQRCETPFADDLGSFNEAAAVAEAETDVGLEALEQQFGLNNALLQQLLEWFGALLTFLTILISIARVIPVPQIKLVAAGAARIVSRIAVFQGAIVARKAANDAAMVVLRRGIQIQKARKAA